MPDSRDGLVRCDDDRRSGVLLAPAHPLNGLDFAEFVRDLAAPQGEQFRIEATFLKAPPAPATVTATISGGVRIVNIQVLKVAADPANPLRLFVYAKVEGDFSTYVLRIEHPDIDPERSEASFSFKAACPTQFDCRPREECPPPTLDEPALDYLAKDYQSFRRLLLDLIPLRNPNWLERLPADLGMALVELFAYAGDYLSYYQDAAATEAFLDTCLHRISAARHARLIDYRMHNGRNAYTYVHFVSDAAADGFVPAGARLLTRIATPLRGGAAAPAVVIPSATTLDFDVDPALDGVVVFETTATARVTDIHNELRIHTWGDADCCLARGSYQAFLYGVPAGADPIAFRPEFAVGDYLLLEEVRSPITGATADRNPRQRQIVRLTEVEDTQDSVYTAQLMGGELTPRSAPGDSTLPLQRVCWDATDGLDFALCLSTPETESIGPVGVARGNVAPADHGRTIIETLAAPSVDSPRRWPLPALQLSVAPLTHQPMPAEAQYGTDNRLIGGRHDLGQDARSVAPAVVLSIHFEDGAEERWEPVPHLLDSGSYDQHFVAEIDNFGEARLRFGDDQYGRRPTDVDRSTARYRVGNGRIGNIGAGALVHLVEPTAAELTDPADPAAAPATFAAIAGVYQPLAAQLGVERETIEEVRQLAPEAFRAIQFRAVTESDWEEMALRHSGVAAAKARFRWTGSWHTVFVAIQPQDDGDLERTAGGGVTLQAEFAAAVTAHLRRFKLAGYDLRVGAAQYVPLEIDLRICVGTGRFRGDVLEAVGLALSNRVLPGGKRGFFHPLEFSFGEDVYLSRLYSAVEAIEGVESVVATKFQRYWEVDRGELAHGVISLGEMEIARLDNDRSLPENGVLRLTAIGGL